MDETATLAAFVSDLDADSIPPDVIDRAITQITDTVGVTLCAANQSFGDRILSYVDASMPGDDATILGVATASATGAAFANGAFAHANDYDDTFESIVIHPSAPVLPAALAVTELTDATGDEFLAAYVAGVETVFHVGHATYPSHYTHGWHSTGTIGSFGAVAAAGSALDFTSEEIRRAFGIVASGSSALLRNAGTMTKPIHAAHAARTGVEAALLAREGLNSDESILSGERGYGAVMTPDGTYDPDRIRATLGEGWGVLDLGVKPYPCGRIMHAAMDALGELVDRESLTVDDVDSIVVSLDDAATELMTYERPTDEFEARASIEFALAAVLREGDAGVEEYSTPYIRDARTREAMALVTRDFEPDLFGEGFANYGARLLVTTRDGDRFEIERRRAPGSPALALDESRRYAKFAECAGSVLDPEAVRSTYDALSRLRDEGALDRVLRTVTPT